MSPMLRVIDQQSEIAQCSPERFLRTRAEQSLLSGQFTGVTYCVLLLNTILLTSAASRREATPSRRDSRVSSIPCSKHDPSHARLQTGLDSLLRPTQLRSASSSLNKVPDRPSIGVIYDPEFAGRASCDHLRCSLMQTECRCT